MSTIYVRNGIWYFQYYQNGQKKKKSLKTKDKATAKRLKVLWDAKLEQRTTGLTPKKIFLSDALNRLYESKIPTLKPSGKAFYENLIRHLSEICQTIQELSPEVISSYCQKRKKEGASLTSIYKEISLLKRTINFLIRCGDISGTPVTEWPVIKQNPKHPDRIGFYSTDEIAKFKEYFTGSDFEGPFLFALYTGCRKSELYGMTVSDINLKENFIKLNVKKTAMSAETSARFISIHPSLKEYFLKIGVPQKGLLFPEIKKHAYDWPHKQIRKACKFLGIQYRRFHGLRHTAATYLLHSGVDLRTVMDILGWKNLETAQRYLHHVRTMKAAEQISSLPY